MKATILGFILVIALVVLSTTGFGKVTPNAAVTGVNAGLIGLE
jgi:hypothetical protein